MCMYAEVNRSEGMVRLSYRSEEKVETHNRVILKSISEFLSLYRAAENWYSSLSGNGDDLYAPYQGEVKEAFDKIASKRQEKLNKNTNIDFGATLLSTVPGESKLVYKPNSGVIQLARRSKNVTTKNSICIPNSTREEFIHDCKKIGNTKYIISRAASESLFDKWQSIAQSEFIRQYLEVGGSVQS